jgi:hypothetical protein
MSVTLMPNGASLMVTDAADQVGISRRTAASTSSKEISTLEPPGG